jgi:hypothetical protein
MWSDREGFVRRALVVLLLSFVLVAAVYRKTPMNFLRAESGWFIYHAHSDPETQSRFQKIFFTGSYGGHYAPLAFCAEFQMARIAGTNESIWKWRQILALVLVGAALAGTVYTIGGVFQLSRFARWTLAAAVAAGSVFRPEMMDFISWPFMILQLVFIGLSVLALYAVIRTVASPEQRRWPWVAAGAAYASMHVSGLGLATVAGVSVVFAGILLVAGRVPSVSCHPNRKRIRSALAVMLCLSIAHGAAMLYLLEAKTSSGVGLWFLSKLLLGFTAHLFTTALQTFLGTTLSEPGAQTLASAWPYGVIVIAGAVLLLQEMLRRSLRGPSPLNLVRFALHGSSVSAFLGVIVLTAARQFESASVESAATSLALGASVPRYVVPLHFLVVASAVDVLALLARRAPRFSSGAFFAIALAALVFQVDYRWNSFPYVAPLARISHSSAWSLIVATVRECRAAKLPVPNVPLGTLTREFSDWDPKMFEPVVRRELHLGREEQIEMIAWKNYLQSGRDRYRQSVPSLQLLEQKLYLQND